MPPRLVARQHNLEPAMIEEGKNDLCDRTSPILRNQHATRYLRGLPLLLSVGNLGSNGVVLSAIVSLLVVATFCSYDGRLLDWFLVPLFLSGVICGFDAIQWIKGRIGTFDPVGLIGLLGFHFFLIAPLLVASKGTLFKVESTIVPDSTFWLGFSGWLNLAGLVCYKTAQRLARKVRPKLQSTFWNVNPRSAVIVIPLMIVISALCHILFFIKLGGFTTFVDERLTGPAQAFPAGYGILMVFGQYLPILLLIGITIMRRKRWRVKATITATVSLFLLVAGIQFLVTGLTGSRNSVIWTAFWILGIIHFFWRPISPKVIIFGIMPLLLYMYMLGFYKSLGGEAFSYAQQGVPLRTMEEASNRDLATVIVGDLSRADVQAAQVYDLVRKPWGYDLRYGATYLSSIGPLIPKIIWPEKSDDSGKVIAGTELLDGPGSYRDEAYIWTHLVGRRSTRIYGLAGEAMLNFGLLGVPCAFFLWGWFVGLVRRWIASIRMRDLRLLLVPFVVNISFLALVNDMDNLMALTLYKFLLPGLVVVLAASTVRVRQIGAPRP